MSACASVSRTFSAETNCSSSVSDNDPSSLQGPRCSASSITPLFACQESASPLNSFSLKRNPFIETLLDRLLHAVHIFDLIFQARGNQIALQLPIRGQHSILNRKCVRAQTKHPHLLVVRELRIDGIERGLHLIRAGIPRYDRAKISAAIAYNDDLLPRRQIPRDFILHHFGRNLVARTQDDKILDPAYNAPVSGRIHLSLIAGVEP